MARVVEQVVDQRAAVVVVHGAVGEDVVLHAGRLDVARRRIDDDLVPRIAHRGVDKLEAEMHGVDAAERVDLHDRVRWRRQEVVALRPGHLRGFAHVGDADRDGLRIEQTAVRCAHLHDVAVVAVGVGGRLEVRRNQEGERAGRCVDLEFGSVCAADDRKADRLEITIDGGDGRNRGAVLRNRNAGCRSSAVRGNERRRRGIPQCKAGKCGRAGSDRSKIVATPVARSI